MACSALSKIEREAELCAGMGQGQIKQGQATDGNRPKLAGRDRLFVGSFLSFAMRRRFCAIATD